MNWMTPHNLYLNTAQNALHIALRESRVTGVHVECKVDSIQDLHTGIAWASMRVMNISKNVAVWARYYDSNKFVVETGWDNELSDSIAEKLRATLTRIQEELENEPRPHFEIHKAVGRKVPA